MSTKNHTLSFTNDHAIVRLLPERGRVLGIEVDGHETLWQPAGTAGNGNLGGEELGGWNLGGERLWFGPEVDWFWQRVGKFDFAFYKVPSALNPDVWTVTHRGADSCRSEIELALSSAHRTAGVRLKITKHFEFIKPTGLESGGGRCIAFRTTTTLGILDGTPGQPVDLWSSLQVPFGGQALVPVVGIPVPRDYFDPSPPSEYESSAGLFALKIGGPAMFKVGLSPDVCAGRFAYARPVGSDWLVLTRSFPAHPDLRYCDSPLDALQTQGDALQFFNDGGNFGNFGELEHRSPAIICGAGPQTCIETTVTCVSLMSEVDHATWKRQFLNHKSIH